MESTTLTDSETKIFTSIGQLMIEDDFMQANSSFAYANCSKFEDTEENKLEYTPIYHEYLHIMETIIEAQLKERYGVTDSEMSAFMENFKNAGAAKLDQYNKLNSETVDSLYGFVDFAKFKTFMLETKSGMKDKDQ